MNVCTAERFCRMKQCPDTYFITVIEDLETSRIVGAATLIAEQKFIHNAAMVSHVMCFTVSYCVHLRMCHSAD